MSSSSSDRRNQCTVMLELLKKFQSCRSHLSNTMQRAEQAIGDQASYMGKDNLQRTTSKVSAPTGPGLHSDCQVPLLDERRTYG